MPILKLRINQQLGRKRKWHKRQEEAPGEGDDGQG